jgi:hypothetical protein
MKHFFLLLPIGVIAVVFYFLYRQGMQIKAKEEKQEAIDIKEENRKKGLEECLAKEDGSIDISIRTNCAVNGILPKTCHITQQQMNDIMQRVTENKEICRLKYSK